MNSAVKQRHLIVDIGRRLLHAKHQGTLWHDLGGIDPEANPGVYQFKSRMGGEEMKAKGPYEAKPRGLASRIIDRLELCPWCESSGSNLNIGHANSPAA